MSTAVLLSVNPVSRIRMVDDWIGGTGGSLNWTVANTGTGAAPTMLAAPNTTNQGVVSMNTGTTATGRSALYLTSTIGTGTMRPYAGAFSQTWYLQVPVLSTGTDRFAFRCGFGDSITADFANGVYFEYDDSVSANWLTKTASASTRTTTGSGVAVSAGSWVKLEIFTDDASVSFSYAINGTTVSTISSNMPALDISPVVHVIKSIGTTARSVYVDYYVLNYNLATTR